MADFSSDDIQFMARALRLAARGLETARPNPVVGCLLVDQDRHIVGEGWHARTGGPHAEVVALDMAGEKARGSTAYVTLEPCSHHGRTPPCAEKLIAAGVGRVIYATDDPNPQVAGTGAGLLREAGIAVSSGLLGNEATEVNRGFFARMQRGRPWVRLKLAVSLDGRTALGNGISQWITGPAARADVHRGRARAGAVLTGAGTVEADNPSLTARPDDKIAELQPIRVVLDSELRMSPDAKLFAEPGEVVVFHARGSAQAQAALEAVGASVICAPAESGTLDLSAVLKSLAEMEINDVWVEAGARLSGALLKACLVDELIIYQAATVLGDSARGMFALSALTDMSERYKFHLNDVRKVGDDLRLMYTPITE